MVELTITVKGESQTYKERFLVYEKFSFDKEDRVLNHYVKQALDNSKIQPEDVKARALMVM